MQVHSDCGDNPLHEAHQPGMPSLNAVQRGMYHLAVGQSVKVSLWLIHMGMFKYYIEMFCYLILHNCGELHTLYLHPHHGPSML